MRLMIPVLLSLATIAPQASPAQPVTLKSVELRVLEGAERQRFLAAHNKARTEVGVDSVNWSDDLGLYALDSLKQQQDKLIDAAKEGWTTWRIALPAHRADLEFGENIAGWVGKTGASAERAVQMWLREKTAFDKLNANAAYRVGDEEGRSAIDDQGRERPIIVGHYTAIVWRATQQIGAAKLLFELVDDRGETRTYTAVICNYAPPGNRRGEQPY
jgi:pathogenesis-related protein 1